MTNYVLELSALETAEFFEFLFAICSTQKPFLLLWQKLKWQKIYIWKCEKNAFWSGNLFDICLGQIQSKLIYRLVFYSTEVYDPKHYFGLGLIPKSKPKLAINTFGWYRKWNQISKGESSYQFYRVFFSS